MQSVLALEEKYKSKENSDNIVEQFITPDKQSIEACLSKKTYYVDFYQREYVWKKETVEVLLNDIFDSFNPSYELYKDAEITEAVLDKFNWYYLNVYITNRVNSKTYIVDGQQRLTTLSLIAIKLHKIVEDNNLKGALEDCIFTMDKWKGATYVIDNAKRKDIMDCIRNEKELPRNFQNVTEETLWHRYQDISQYIDNLKMDSKKVIAFAHYFLERLVMVELSISKDDTPMVFEVINDRGESLKPFEILKGKLIGALDKNDSEEYAELWDKSIEQIKGYEDDFFIDYIKAKYLRTKTNQDEIDINNKYHRYILDNNEVANKLGFRPTDANRILNIKKFIASEMVYYCKLYGQIRSKKELNLHYLNDLLYLSGQYQLILSACILDDSDETIKVRSIAKEYERLYMLLVFNGVYGSNMLKQIVEELNEKLSVASIGDYRAIFNGIIIEQIKKVKNIATLESILEYRYFLQRDYSNLPIMQLRYFYARIEQYICEQIGCSMQSSVEDITLKRGNQSGYHIEHILSHNDTNINYFSSTEEFESKRNLLGGLLLLRGKDNISSSNEEYKDKLKTYSVGLVWGHTLCKDFYHINKNFDDFNKRIYDLCGRKFQSYDVFDDKALEERSLLLYELVKIIWEVEDYA